VRARAWLTVRLFMDGFSSNFGWTYYTSQQVARHTYFSCSRTARMRASARVRARAWFNSQLSLDGFSSNLMGTYYTWPQVTCDTYLSCSVTACVCACACASVHVRARVWLSRVWVWQIPTGYMRYLICVWMHVLTARTCLHLRICLARDGQWLV
jgi:hypothetical protein